MNIGQVGADPQPPSGGAGIVSKPSEAKNQPSAGNFQQVQKRNPLLFFPSIGRVLDRSQIREDRTTGQHRKGPPIVLAPATRYDRAQRQAVRFRPITQVIRNDHMRRQAWRTSAGGYMRAEDE